MRQLAIISLTLLLVLGSCKDCFVDKSALDLLDRACVYRDQNGDFQLLRVQQVASGTKLYMYCTASDRVEIECQDNGAFEPVLARAFCEQPFEASVKKDRDADCPYTLYIVGHSMNGQHLELYRSCFNAREGRVLYSQSTVYYKTVVGKRPWMEFNTDQIITPAEATAYMKSRIYETFLHIFGSNQQYISSPKHLVINRGHLVASADFLFRSQMASTFRYINVVPQFKSINDGNWEKIERWLRDRVSIERPFLIRTGGHGVLTLAHPEGGECPVYLAGNKLPVPQWIYKVVRDSAADRIIYVFISYNSIYAAQRPAAPDWCQEIACPLRLPNYNTDGYIYCCNPNDFRINIA